MHESLTHEEVSKEKLTQILHETYFVPEGTPLNIQLLNFQRQRKRIALVVDEYGEIQGLVSLEDILEEIVGEFTTTVATSGKVIQAQSDGSYLVDGAITIRELNRTTEWKLPLKGPRTLNGLIIENLETIPRTGICVKIANYPIEIIDVKENRVKIARVFPRLSND
jgi:Mg2+/Co2+ transporter CorB